MTRHVSILLAGPSLFVLATTAAAQTPTNPTPPSESKSADAATQAQEANKSAEQTGDEGTIIITARRRAESLLAVPQTVNAVTSEDFQKYQVLDFEDISQLVPGLTLTSDNSGFNARAQVRGVNFQVTAQGTPTVEMYLNEVPIEPNTMFQGTFDIGQVEVLRGPQGTLRGRSSPSGAITQTTRRPDLNEIGGYVSFVGNSHGGLNGQAALGLPIISDVLALRVAGLVDSNDADGVKSANNPTNPREVSKAFRATLRFEPNSNISAVIMYQYQIRNIHSYGGIVFGPGAGGLTNFPGFTRPGTTGATEDNSLVAGTQNCPAGSTVGQGTCVSLPGGSPGVFAPPGFNGPVLLESEADEHGRAIQDVMAFTRNAAHIVTAQLDWRFAGQKLSYVGGLVEGTTINLTDGDATNTIVGKARKVSRNSCCGEDRRSHELRLSSDERLFGMLDYTVGAYYGKTQSKTINENLNQFLLPGAFGSPLGLSATNALGLTPSILTPFTYNAQYTMGFTNIVPQKQVEKAIFANIMLHLGEKTEISAGGRQIWRMKDAEVAPVATNGVTAIRNPNATPQNPFAACPATLSGPGFVGNVINGTVIGQTYPGTCDVVVTPGNGALTINSIIPPIPRMIQKWSPFVYSFSVSHKFTPDLMVYANYGTSWRQGPGPVIAAPVCAAQLTPNAPDPHLCDRFNFLDSETTKGIELGFKGAFLNRRLSFTMDVFRQKFKGFFIRGDSSVPILTGNCTTLPVNNVQGGCSVGSGTFTYNADVVVKGLEAEADFRLSEDLNVSALFSWSKGQFQDSPVPCRDTNFDGIPDSNPLPSGPLDWVTRGGPYGPAMCPTGGSSTTAPPWNLTLRGEYSHPVFTGGRAFIRALFNYYPKNTNLPDAVSVDGPPADRVAPKSYSLLSLWVGLRGEKGDWEVSASARNLLNNRTVLSRALDVPNLINPTNTLLFGVPTTGTNVPSGYRSISFVERREFQLSFRYSFGSR
jgi:iron complex outermembrane recepter protein